MKVIVTKASNFNFREEREISTLEDLFKLMDEFECPKLIAEISGKEQKVQVYKSGYLFSHYDWVYDKKAPIKDIYITIYDDYIE